jgi:hypothetical protein
VIGDGRGAKAPVDNEANGLYRNIENDQQIRNADLANSRARELGLEQGIDFEILRGARQLSPQEYTFQPQLGYISLNTPIGRDEIIAVAFEYTLQGRRYKVGELTEDYQTRNERETIILKLIRPAAVRTDLPTWDLMMKNIYSLGAGQINREGFQLRVIYKDDLTGIDNPSLQEGRYTKDVPLLQVFNLDRLNPQGDPQPDGNFDWVEGVTIDSRAGRIIFPVLEPFGSHLTNDDGRATTQPPPPWFDPQTEQALVNKYVFTTLYESTRNDAQQIAEKNKFFIKGTYQGTASNDVQLPTFGADAGAVSVTLGGTPLVQGQDYILENGQVRIINEASPSRTANWWSTTKARPVQQPDPDADGHPARLPDQQGLRDRLHADAPQGAAHHLPRGHGQRTHQQHRVRVRRQLQEGFPLPDPAGGQAAPHPDEGTLRHYVYRRIRPAVSRRGPRRPGQLLHRRLRRRRNALRPHPHSAGELEAGLHAAAVSPKPRRPAIRFSTATAAPRSPGTPLTIFQHQPGRTKRA